MSSRAGTAAGGKGPAGSGQAPSSQGGSAPGTGNRAGSSPAGAPQSGAGQAGQAGAGGKSPFVHPGLLVTRGMLDFVKGKLATTTAPWQAALTRAQTSRYGALTYSPHPRTTVECGPYSNPDFGCTDEKDDAIAAYTHALLWYHTGNEANAKKAIEIMNAWSSTVTAHTNSNAPLQSAWVAETFPRAAEIIRYTYSGWTPSEVQAFATMLKNVYLPLIVNGSSSNGNWELSMIEGTLNIGVFLDDKATFDKAVTMWRERVPAYLYLTSDGAAPASPPRGAKSGAALVTFWYNQTTYVDGLCQETCRDLGHVQYGLAAMLNAAETARIQGVDLYGEQAQRLRAGLEFHANFLNGAAVPAWLCGGTLTAVTAGPMWEIAYNEYAGRRSQALPQSKALVLARRPTSADHHMAWETLTHGDIGAAGLP